MLSWWKRFMVTKHYSETTALTSICVIIRVARTSVCARHHTWAFTHINSFSHYKQQMKQLLELSPLKAGKWRPREVK